MLHVGLFHCKAFKPPDYVSFTFNLSNICIFSKNTITLYYFGYMILYYYGYLLLSC